SVVRKFRARFMERSHGGSDERTRSRTCGSGCVPSQGPRRAEPPSAKPAQRGKNLLSPCPLLHFVEEREIPSKVLGLYQRFGAKAPLSATSWRPPGAGICHVLRLDHFCPSAA